jgi:hypothetical protein
MLQTLRFCISLVALLWVISSCNAVLLPNKQPAATKAAEAYVLDNPTGEPASYTGQDDGAQSNEMAAAAETNHMKYAKPTPEVIDLKQNITQEKVVHPSARQPVAIKPFSLKRAYNRLSGTNRAKDSNTLKIRKEEGEKTDGFALASMILGIASIFLILLPVTNIVFLSLASAVLAVIFGAIGLKRIRQNPETLRGKGFGLAGLVTGIVFLALVLIFIVAIIASYG